ncbi:MAG: alpha/beta hydrolase family protein [Brevinematia bacterium]
MKKNNNISFLKDFFPTKKIKNVSISPVGDYLSYILENKNTWNIIIRKLGANFEKKIFSTNKKIITYFWNFDNSSVISFILDKQDKEYYYLLRINVANGKQTKLLDKFKGQIIKYSYKCQDNLLIGIKNSVNGFQDVFSCNLKNGFIKLVLENKSYLKVLADENYNLIFGIRIDQDGKSFLLEYLDDKTPVLKIPFEDFFTTYPILYDETKKLLYFIDSRNEKFSALAVYDLMKKKEKILFYSQEGDLVSYLIHPTRKVIQAVATYYSKKKWFPLEDESMEIFDFLEKNFCEKEINVISKDISDNHWVLQIVSTDSPEEYYLFDKKNKMLTKLFSTNSRSKYFNFNKMQTEIIKTRDGWDILCYYTLPNFGLIKLQKNKLPLILHIHGGPWSRVYWGFNFFHQWFSNTGCAVLSVNFRGSKGFGKSFLYKGLEEIGERMHEDLIDSVYHFVKKGFIDENKIGVIGTSFGGYMAIWCLIKNPSLFKCAISISGPVNLFNFFKKMSNFWLPLDEFFNFVTDLNSEKGKDFLIQHSPVKYYEKINKPLFIVHGENDEKIQCEEVENFVKILKANNRDVWFLKFENEGHEITKLKNRKILYTRIEIFLKKYLFKEI